MTGPSLLLLLSGMAGLGYQLVWTRLFALGLGHEYASMLAVVSAFFGGLTLGAWLFRRWLGTIVRPAYGYAALELIIAVWALVTAWLIGPAAQLANQGLGIAPSPFFYWTTAFLWPFLTLLPATVAMGATLPAAERWFSQLSGDTHALARVYAVNTLGAMLGVLAATFWLMPTFGYRTTLIGLAMINAGVALAAVVLDRRRPIRLTAADRQHSPAALSGWLGVALLVTGLLGIAYEVVTVRVMAQVFEGTVYSFAAALTVYLAGTALGAAVYHRFCPDLPLKLTSARLSYGLSLVCLLGTGLLYVAHPGYWWLRRLGDDSPLAVLGAELGIAVPVLLPPTVLMGALFSHLALTARREQGHVGAALAVNLAGGLIAPPLAGAWLVPAVGPFWTLAGIAMGYLLLALRSFRLPLWYPALPALMLVLLPKSLAIVTLRDGETLNDYRDGALASVAVIERGQERNLRVNNRFQMGGTVPRALRIQRMQSHLPLLLHPKPEKALFLGVATGITVGAATLHPNLA
ncbi:MAG: hypothetical protein RQ715_10745, partial [Methylococcales bacterium]|nr:hypothetical protein [Methylococcales bacterium]